MPMLMNVSRINSKTVFWLCILALSLFAIAYSSSLFVLGVVWSGVESAGYSHGFLVLGCTVYLLYLKKEEFKKLIPGPNYWALLPLIGFSLLWFVAMVSGVQTVQLTVLPLLLLFAITLFLGNQFLKLAFIPIILLFLALPAWNLFLPYLQDITTQTAHFNLNLIGRPVFVSGNYLRLPGGTFLVEESCSGLRFLLVASTLALMFSSMNSLKIKQGTLLLGISILLAFIANWVRVLAVVLIGDYTNMQSSLVDDHANLGWGIFLVLVLIPFFLITRFFPEPLALEGRSSSKVADNIGLNSSRFYSVFVLACCAILIGPLLYKVYGRQQPAEARAVTLPGDLASWYRAEFNSSPSSTDWRPIFTGASENLYAEYINSKQRVELYIVYYANQQQNAELINVENQMADDEQWFITRGSEDKITLTLEGGRIITLVSMEVKSRQGQHKKVWYWYSIGGLNTVDPYLAKLYQVSSLLNHRTDASLIAMAINCESNCASVDNQLKNFLDVMYPAIIESL